MHCYKIKNSTNSAVLLYAYPSRIFSIFFHFFYPEDEAIVEVHVPGSENKEAIFRKRTVGILDMGGVSTQIAYEVPKTVSFASSQQVIICATFFFSFWFILMHFRSFVFFGLSPLLHYITFKTKAREDGKYEPFIS